MGATVLLSFLVAAIATAAGASPKWIGNLAIMVALLLLFGGFTMVMSLLVGAVVRLGFKRSKAPWANFDANAERLHKLTHPDERDEDG